MEASMKETGWARGILLKVKKEEKSRDKKRVKRQIKRQAKSLIRTQSAAAKPSAETPAPESSEQK
jgi:hypothetical protein